MKRLTIRDGRHIEVNCGSCPNSGKRGTCHATECWGEAGIRLAAIEDILGDDYDLDHLRESLAACKGLEPSEIAESKLLIATRKDPEKLARMAELVDADQDGRCVVLPVPMHRTLLDTSDPIRPELLKNFRISATWDHCGIVFHSPWNCFLTDIGNGHIRLLNEAAEAALKESRSDEHERIQSEAGDTGPLLLP